MKICKYHNTISLDTQEIEMLKNAHQAIFSEVLKIRPSWLSCIFEPAQKNYLMVPLQVIPPEIFSDHPALSLEVYIDTESVKQLADLVTCSQSSPGPTSYMKPVSWPVPVDRFNNAIIIPNHDDKRTLHEVKEVSETINISSPFPDLSVAPTFLSYFTKKYGCSLSDSSQPALKCKILGTSSSYLQLLTSRYKSSGGEDTKKSNKRGRIIELFPELCSFYPLPANLWKLIRLLPSILWRIECILTVDALRYRISSETGIGQLKDGSELTTLIRLRGYKDMGYGDLASQKYMFGQHDHHQYQSEVACNPLDTPLRGPDNALMLQALTTKSAGDCVDLERLETLGDSFLKFSTTIFLFCDRSAAHEGRLTSARSRRVGNFNLYYLAKCQGIAESVFSSNFDPFHMWIPPGFNFNEEDHSIQTSSGASQENQPVAPSQPDRSESVKPKAPLPASDHEKHYLYHKLTDKGVADCMESLIGAYLVSGGILAGLKLMAWMGIKITRKQNGLAEKISKGGGVIRDDHNGASPSVFSKLHLTTASSSFSSSSESYAQPPRAKQPRRVVESSPLFVCDSATILNEYFKPPPRPWSNYKDQQMIELRRLLSIAVGNGNIETIDWTFKDRRLLLQALTHASYTKNRLTDSYQRLEFLGDAVLDYLVTCHIYSTFPEYGPGEISSIRSALVDNISFAELAVELKLNSALLHNSPSLFKQIELYLSAVKKCSLETEETTGSHCDEIFCDTLVSGNEEDEVCCSPFFLSLCTAVYRLGATM